MPLYEYQCDACAHRFEAIQKFSDAPLATCPKCGGAVQKLQSAPAFHLKGSGWYITDYARKDQGATAGGKDKPAGGDTGEKADKGEKTEAAAKNESPTKASSETASAPAKTDASAPASASTSGSGPSAPTK